MELAKKNFSQLKTFQLTIQTTILTKEKNSLLIKGKSILGSSESGKFMDVNGVSLYYEIYGEGEPLLMIHGNGNSMSGFIGNIEDLSN